MKLVRNYKEIFILLAIVSVFSTVLPDRVFASKQIITNVLYSSESTGSVSKNGISGQDGADGHDGTPGSSGSNTVTIDHNASATLTSKSDAHEIAVVHVEQTIDSREGSSFVFATQTVSSTTVAQSDTLQSHNGGISLNAIYALKDRLFSFQIMLVNYVSILF